MYTNEIGGLIEVKTAPSNYKKAKNTISTRLGEDFEAEKPIATYSAQPSAEAQRELKTNTDTPNAALRGSKLDQHHRTTQGDQQSSKRQILKDISDERVEEIKLEHYNRKLANQSNVEKKGSKNHASNAAHSDSKQNNRFNVTGSSYNQQQPGGNQRSTQYAKTKMASPDKQVVLDNYSAVLQNNS